MKKSKFLKKSLAMLLAADGGDKCLRHGLDRTDTCGLDPLDGIHVGTEYTVLKHILTSSQWIVCDKIKISPVASDPASVLTIAVITVFLMSL